MRFSPSIVAPDPALRHARPLVDPALSRLDRLGILISSLCLVHCLALPLVITLLPTFAEVLPPDFWVHLMLIGVAFPVTGFTLLRGYLAHRNRRPLLLGVTGLLLVAWGLFAVEPITGAAFTVIGGLLVACAHIINMRDHRSRCSDEHHARS